MQHIPQRRPVIGVPTQTLQTLGSIPADFPASWVMSQRYILTLTQGGAAPVMLPLVSDEETLRAIYETLDGVFLPGGADVDPASYGADRHPRCDRTDPARDSVEMSMVKWAMEDRKPVLGVCRGLQVINLALGGTLWQDLAEQRPGSIKHDYFPFGGRHARDFLAHEVTLQSSSRLADLFGARAMQVNSMHHQGIRALARPLMATAIAPDGLVEAAELPGDHYVVGVQWHPEALTEADARSRRLFESFTAAAREWRDAKAIVT